MATKENFGVGLDVGTMNIVAARNESATSIGTKRVRNAFIDMDPDAKKTLKMSKVDYIEEQDKLLVLGDSALSMANVLKRDIRRPLAKGVVSAGEIDAQQVLSLLVYQVLGEASKPDEHCYYSVPAAPIDADQDVIYHQEVFRKIITEHRYTAHPMNEAMAIIYSECADQNFSGVAISFGSGMCNVALSYQTMECMSFSLSRGGDWIDTHAAKAVGSTASRMCAVKERGDIDISNPSKDNRDAEAIALYIRNLINYCLGKIVQQVRKESGSIYLPEPIPLVVSGGTTLATGFMEVLNQEFEQTKKKGFPFEVSDIRRAKDPMTAVAKGLLVNACLEEG